MYLPIAAEAEAASRAVAELPAAERDAPAPVTENLPAPAEPLMATVEHYEEPAASGVDAQRGAPLIPSIPDATKAAARWIRPLVPPFVARVIDNTTQPLRTARQVFEEVEEIAFSLKRTRKVTVNSESSDGGVQQLQHQQQPPLPAPAAEPGGTGAHRIDSSRGRAAQPNYGDTYGQVGGTAQQASLGQVPARDTAGLSVGAAGTDARRELVEREGPRELRSPDGPRQLPPGR